MTTLIRIFCLVGFVVVSRYVPVSTNPYEGLLSVQIQNILINNRQAFADGFRGLPPLDPMLINGPFNFSTNYYTAKNPVSWQLRDVTITGLTAFKDINVLIMNNGVFALFLNEPALSWQGNLQVPEFNWNTNGFRATLSNVQLIITGHLAQTADQLTLDDLHVNLNVIGNATVKVIGLTRDNLLNTFVSDFLTQQFSGIINNDSDTYASALGGAIESYLNQVLSGQSYAHLVYVINNLAGNNYPGGHFE